MVDLNIINKLKRKKIAHDLILFNSQNIDNLPPKNVTIIDAIRNEILYAQQLYLQNAISAEIDEEKREKFLNKNLNQFRLYLTTDEGKYQLENILKEKQIKIDLNKIEVKGYKKINTDFKADIMKVKWEKINKKNIKRTEIRNDEGKIITALIQNGVKKEPFKIRLDNGKSCTIKKYRKIDFPTKLDKNGPLHLSMIVKDKNGKNIADKDAVYFTAHYGEDGKLKEISSPIPIKFAGSDKNAIGYIEVKGKIFTLPVTRDNYQKMLHEVSINNGKSVDISQQVEIYQKKDKKSKQTNPVTRELRSQVEEIIINTQTEHSKEESKVINKLVKANSMSNLKNNNEINKVGVRRNSVFIGK